MMNVRALTSAWCALSIACAAAALSQAATNDLFNDAVIQQVSLTVDPNDWASLLQNYQQNTYYHAQLSWNGVSMDVGIRSRGNTSRSGIKPNLDVNIDKYVKKQTLDGVSFFNLNANNEDPSALHNPLAFKFFQRMGIPAPRTAPAQVYINGQLFGFYDIIEHADEDFLTRNYGEDGGYLYEWEWIPGLIYEFQSLGSDPSVYAQFLDLKTDQDSPDLQTFANFINAVNATASDTDYVSGVSVYMNPAYFMEFAAIQNAFAQYDGLLGEPVGANNFFLYQFQGTTSYTLFPWDQDLGFYAYDWDILQGLTSDKLTNRLMQIPEYKNIYFSTLLKATEALGDAGGWADRETTREYNLIHDAALNDPHKMCLFTQNPGGPCVPGAFEQYVAALRQVIEQRKGYILSRLATQTYSPISNEPVVENVSSQVAPGAQIVPGSMAVLNGQNLGVTAASPSGTLSRVLGNTYVAVNGIRAPLSSVTPNQIVFQIPPFTSAGTASVVAVVNGILSMNRDVQIADVSSGSNPLAVRIDIPGTSSAPFLGTISASGWVVDPQSAIQNIQVLVDSIPVGSAQYGLPRPDVCLAYADSIDCPGAGWSFSLDTTKLGSGSHTLAVIAVAANGQQANASTQFSVANWTAATADPIRLAIDSPVENTSLSGVALVGGWAIDDISSISGIGILVDGVSAGAAGYGGVRADVCSAYPNRPSCPNVGWNYALDTTLLADGSHNFTVVANAQSGASTTTSRTFVVANHVSSSPIQICIDRPNKQSPPFRGVSSFGGWAIANAGSIDHIDVKIDGLAFRSADYGGGRPDVCEMYPNRTGCPNVGWNLSLDTTVLTNGSHSLALTAYQSNGQHSTVATSFQVSNDADSNPTRVFIDQPNPWSPIVTGVRAVTGWAINDNSQIGTVVVFADNAPVGNASYGLSRPDVCVAYPSRAGCPAVGWSFVLDTTKFANGIHSLSVLATAANGQHFTANTNMSVANWTSDNPIKISIDTPQSSNNPLRGNAILGGWAISDIDQIIGVDLSVDGLALGQGIYGNRRSDVCRAFPGRAGCPNVGWSYMLDSSLLGDGVHELEVTVNSMHGQSSTATKHFTVANLDDSNSVNIAIDSPIAGSTVNATAIFGGWAFDELSTITNISVVIDGIPYGSAAYGGVRHDVCARLGTQPGCPNLGWGFALDTTQLVNGPHTLTISATNASGDVGRKSASFAIQN